MALTYSGEQIRQHDPDRFLLSLFAPADRRAALWTLFAFNHEIAKTREVVSETQLGLIRLQWWREAIGEIYDGQKVREHEVLLPLAAAIQKYDLPRETFERLIYAREFDLEDVPPADLKGFINYADYTTTPLNDLAMTIIGDSETESIIRAVSVHYAVTGLVRAVSHMRNQRRMMLPSAVMAAHDISQQKFFDFNTHEALPEVIKEVISCVEPYRKPKSGFLKASRALSDIYLKQIQNCGFDVYSLQLSKPPAFKELRVSIAATF